MLPERAYRGTSLIRNRIYRGTSLIRNRIYRGTSLIRNRIYRGTLLIRNMIYRGTSPIRNRWREGADRQAGHVGDLRAAVGPNTEGVQRGLEMKDPQDLKDLMTHDL